MNLKNPFAMKLFGTILVALTLGKYFYFYFFIFTIIWILLFTGLRINAQNNGPVQLSLSTNDVTVIVGEVERIQLHVQYVLRRATCFWFKMNYNRKYSLVDTEVKSLNDITWRFCCNTMKWLSWSRPASFWRPAQIRALIIPLILLANIRDTWK